MEGAEVGVVGADVVGVEGLEGNLSSGVTLP